MYQEEKVDMRSFGQAVMEARENKGWSREKLAEMLDLSIRHVMYIETRGQRPRVQNCKKPPFSLYIQIFKRRKSFRFTAFSFAMLPKSRFAPV